MNVVDIPNAFFQHDAQSKFDPDVHIDPGFTIDKFISQEGVNTLIEGIRGTGKTHILKMISTKLLQEFDDLRVLPVYISMAEVSEFVSKEDSLFRMHLYSTLILQTIETIKGNKDSIYKTHDSNFIKKVTRQIAELFKLKETEDIDDLIYTIENYAKELHTHVLQNPAKIEELIRTTGEFGGGFKSPYFNAEGKYGEEESRNVEYLTVKLSHLNASQFLTTFYKYLRELFNLKHTVLLVDECSDLPKEAQTEIFRFFKLVRGGTRVDNTHNFLYFIGGVYPPQATEYPSKIHGGPFDFEPGDDCSLEYLELDTQVSFYEDFFKNLFLKKMEKFKPELSTNILNFFEDERAFFLAAYSAHGLPRRFFEISHQSYENLKEFVSSKDKEESKQYKIRYNDVSIAIDKITSSNMLARGKMTAENFDTLEKITAALKRRNKKVETESATKENYVPINFYFTCPRSKEDLLGNLIAKGIVHNQARTRSLKYSPDSESGKGLVMMIDLAVAFSEGAIPTKTKALDYFQKDTKLSARRGYEFCQTISF